MVKYSKTISKSKKKDQEACLEYLDDLLRDSESFYKPLRKKWNTFEYLYTKGASKSNTPRGRANLALPIAFQQIEPFVDNLSELMFGETPYIVYTPRNSRQEVVESAEDISKFTQWQMEAGEFYPEMRKYLRNLGKLGNSVMKIAWEEDTIERDLDPQEFEFDEETGEVKDLSTEELMFDGPRFYNLSLFEFRIPKGTAHCDIQKMAWCAHEVYRDPEDLLDNDNYWMAKSKIKKILKGNDTLESSKQVPSAKEDGNKSREASLALYSNESDGTKKNQGKWRVIEWWGKYDLGKGYKEASLIVIAYPNEDEPLILRKDPNPFKYKFKPFVMSYDYPIDGEAYGYGELNHVKGLISESTALRNARLDRTNISLNSMWLVERQSGINVRELYTAPDKVILCDDKDGISKLENTGPSSASVEEIGSIDYDIQNTTEILNPRQNVSNVGAAFGRTATGINYLQSKTGLRITSKAKLLQYTFIRPLARILLWYNRQFMSDGTKDNLEFKVTGDEINSFSQMDPMAFMADVDFIPESTPIRKTIAEQGDALDYMLQVMGQLEKISPGVINLREMLIKTFELKGFSRPEKFINPEGPTIVVDTHDGQLLDEKGQPVQVVPIEQIQGGEGGQGG
jgi:hypothetical protein